MFSFRKSLIAAVGLLALIITFAALLAPAVSAQKDRAPRKFYLTKTQHNGSQALSACAAGYHMASIWEIFDPSNLRYDTQLGVTTADSGFGPPAGTSFIGFFGWVRTGDEVLPPFAAVLVGRANCNAWTSANEAEFGTAVNLNTSWANPPNTALGPWGGTTIACSNGFPRVWCVQD